MKTCIQLLGVTALATSLGFAQEGPPEGPGGPGGPKGPGAGRPNPAQIFKKLDTDSNGSLSFEEFKVGPLGQKNPERAEKVFAKLDADSDGAVTLEEFKNGRPPRPHGPGKGRPGQGGGDGDPPPVE
jgi:hypothetical protein